MSHQLKKFHYFTYNEEMTMQVIKAVGKKIEIIEHFDKRFKFHYA